MKRKILVVAILAIVTATCAYGLAGCGNKPSSASSPSTPSPAASSAAGSSSSDSASSLSDGSSSSDSTSSALDGSSSSDSTSSASDSSSPSDAGNQTAIDQVVAAAQSQISSLKQSFASTYSDITITGEGDNILVYTYTYKDQQDAASTKASLESATVKDAVQKTLDDQVFPALKSAGVIAPQAKYIYKNADGSVIDTMVFSAK